MKEQAERHIPGEPGMWIFIFGDMMLFVVYFANFLLVRIAEPAVFGQGRALLDQNLGALNTVVLLTSSLFVLGGLAAIRRKDALNGPWLFGGALVCALAFCGLKAIEWSGKIAQGITPGTDSFFQFYYILTGLHLVHVILGIGVLAFLMIQARRQTHSPGMTMAIEGGACWWHMVDLIWMILFPLIYLAR